MRTCSNFIITPPFSFSHVVRRVDLCCCYCRTTGAAVAAAAADSRSYAALLLSLHSSPTVDQTHPRCSTTVDKQQAEATTADNKQQADATMMGTTGTEDNQPVAAG
jgi:hypothetical protein